MKSTLTALAIVAAAACMAGPSASAASSSTAASARAHHATMTDVSSARRYYSHRHHAYRSYAGARAYAPAQDWSGVNAGNRPDSLLSFYRQNHICAIDEGYGRVTRCD